jgi:DNA mismatch repair protein MutS
VANGHFEAREWGDEVIFLRRLVDGGANRSYGIQVARLAGLPAGVVERAREILQNLEGGEFDERGRPRLAGRGDAEPPGSDQLGLFAGGVESEVLDRLRGVDPERVTPLEALELLSQLVTRLGDPR